MIVKGTNIPAVPQNTKLYLIEPVTKNQDILCYYKDKDLKIVRVVISYSQLKNQSIFITKENELTYINELLRATPKMNFKFFYFIGAFFVFIALIAGYYCKRFQTISDYDRCILYRANFNVFSNTKKIDSKKDE